jgi:hypothetical protein
MLLDECLESASPALGGNSVKNGVTVVALICRNEFVTVPEPATLTLIDVAASSGLLLHRWRSRRKKSQS